MGLHDAVLIKDNHLAGVGVDRLAAAVFSMLNRLEELRPPPKFVEIEVDTLDQLDAILRVVGVDVVLLDNFNPADMCKAVRLRDELGLKGKVALEASGSVTAASVRAIAAGGVDRIAVGAITHSARGLDIAMDLA
jgi:nicotinate-nucleotide pyrophosphorylase (carboxylating)